MIVETIDDYRSFRNETKEYDLITSVIPADDSSIHAAVSKPSIVFVKNAKTDKTYIFSFNHPDYKKHIDFDMFKIDLSSSMDKNIWCFDKKSAYHLLKISNFLDIELFTHLKENWIVNKNECETSAHKLVRRNNNRQRNINHAIPLLKHKEMFEKMCSQTRSMVILPQKNELDVGYIWENKMTVQTLAELENTGIHINPLCFKNHFPEAEIHNNDLVYSQYNPYTATGRPSNRFDNVNYAALNKSDGVRKCFNSRFGEEGKMVLIDFSAFHPRIISYLIKFPLNIDVDIYKYLGELYFNRSVNEYDMDEIKGITMRQFYGGVEEKYKHIRYLSHAKDFIEKYWLDFQKHGFIRTPVFKRVITNKHLLDPNPPKVLNYILQATETEIATMILRNIQRFLEKYETKAILYTYDSILFDFYKPEQSQVFKTLVDLMRMVDKFPVKVYEGETYDTVNQITL